MKSETQDQISASTKYRYAKANRESELPDFLQFKKDNLNALNREQICQLKKIYHHGCIGRNVNQHTVIIDRVGSIKLNEISKIVRDEEFVSYLNQRMLQLSQHILKQKQEVIWILDLGGPILQLASKRVYSMLQKIIQNLKKYFPQILHKLYFVNTPMLFDTVWNKISSLIDEKTEQKIILLTDELEELYADVDPVMLPECLGGNCSNNILKQPEYKQQEQIGEEQQEQQIIDMSSLKAALSGLKIGSKNHGSVAQTPLNTENDDYKQ